MAEAFLATSRPANPTPTAPRRPPRRGLGWHRLLAEVSDDEVGQVLTKLWGGYAPATWSRNRAAVSSWPTWCRSVKRWVAPSVPAEAERRKEVPDENPGRGQEHAAPAAVAA